MLPAQRLVELLGPVDARNRDDDDIDLHVHDLRSLLVLSGTDTTLSRRAAGRARDSNWPARDQDRDGRERGRAAHGVTYDVGGGQQLVP